MKSSIPLVFFGTDQFSRVILEDLLEAGYDIALVVTAPQDQSSQRDQKLSPVAQVVDDYCLPSISPDELDDSTISKIKKYKAQYAVLASYGKLLPESVLDCFKSIINVHPSLLPRWRGPSPIEAAILNGTQTTGVSLIKLVKAMDAGPIYAQSQYDLSGNETQSSLREDLAKAGSQLLLKSLPDILDGNLQPQSQDEQSATYCRLITKADGELDWTKTASQLERQIRAYQQWPQSRAKLFERDVIVTEALAKSDDLKPGQTNVDNGTLSVGTTDGVLTIKRLKPAGRQEMSAIEFLNGLKS